jgi:hypothetical protein
MNRVRIAERLAAIGFCLLVVPSLGACMHDIEPVTQTPRPSQTGEVDQRRIQVERVHLNNPAFTEEMYFKATIAENLIQFAMWDGRCLLGGGYPVSYEALVAEGSLPIILVNRYTGKDLVSTPDYSPGDIFLEVDEDEQTIHFHQHMGELDAAYDPDAVPTGERLP